MTPLFRIWGSDNIAYGPVELPDLVKWVQHGRVLKDTWIFLEKSQTWIRASGLSELRMFFNSQVAADHAPQATPKIKPGSLRRIKILSAMEESMLQSFVQYMEVLSFKQFSTIVRKGDHGAAMFLVLEGEVRARVMIDDRETTLATLTSGEFFGEMSLLDEGPRSADIVANADSVLLKISADAFQNMIQEAPGLATPFLFALSRSVVGRVRKLTKKYQDSIHFSRMASGIS